MGPKTTRSSRRKADDAENSLGDSTGSHYTGQDDTKVHEANPDDDHQADQHELGQPKKSPIEDEAAADSNTVEGDPSQKTSQNEESKKEEGGQEDKDIHDNDPLNDPHISAEDDGFVCPFEDDFDEIPEDGTGQTALNKVTTDDLQVRGGLRPPNDTRAIAQAVPPRPAIPQGDPPMRQRGYLLPEQGMHGRQVENYHDPRGSSKPIHLKTIEERPPQPQRSGPPLRRRSTEWYENDYYNDDGHNLSRSSRWSEEEWDDWQEHQDRQKISKVISDVEWITPILGKDKYWDGSVDMPDSVALSEFRYKLTTSPDFEYQSECHKYFTVRHNLSDSIKKLLDVYEHNSDLQPETYHQPHKLNSRYWSDRLKQLWRYLSTVFGDSDGGFLETQWINMYLKKTDKFIDFYAHHESVAKELARTRGYKSLTEQEKKSHFYNCMPAKLKVHLDEQGYWTPGAVNYDRLILLAQSWCRVHWDKAVTVNHVDVSHPAKKTTDSEERDREPLGDLPQRPRSSEPVVKSYPVKLKVRDDEKVLNDPKNQEILQASCGRCLDKTGTHKADTCCNPISYKDQRCRFCGLFHDLKTRCPEKFDSYQKKCPRCGRPNHGAMACFSKNPSVQGLSAIFIDNPGMGTSHYVDFQINDCEKTSRALLDSGAAMSVIHAGELAKVPNVVIEDTDLVVRTADGGNPAILGIARDLKLHFADRSIVYESFLVVTTPLSHSILLSTNALRGIGAVWVMTDTDNVMLLGTEAKSMVSTHHFRQRKKRYSPQPFTQGVIEICDLAVDYPDSNDNNGRADASTQTPTCSVPNDLMEEIMISSQPKAVTEDDSYINQKGLTDDQKVLQVKNTNQSDEETKPFQWRLAPPTPRSRLGRFCLEVPWRSELRPDDKLNHKAIQRSIATDSRLSEADRGAYLGVIKSLYEEGYVRQERLENIKHLIPSFPVTRPDHLTTKVRLVTDGSVGLNPLCRDGPVMNDEKMGMTLMSNLHLFRMSPYVILDDLRRAFYQILIEKHNEPYFGMANKFGAELLIGVWIAMGFGSNYAPSALGQAALTIVELNDYYFTDHDLTVLGEVALQVINDYLKVVGADCREPTTSLVEHEILENGPSVDEKLKSHVSIYVDDVQSRGETIAQTERVAGKMMNGFKDHGFDDNPKKRVKSWEDHDGHYLGYGLHNDYLFVDYRPDGKLLKKDGRDLTRREAFRLVMSYYDPIGLGIELAGRLRYLGRQCYRASSSWDGKIDGDYGVKLIELCEHAKQVSSTTTRNPRLLNVETIHTFTDASQVAGAQVVYDAAGNRVFGSCHLYSATEDKWTIPKKETLSFCEGVCTVANYIKMIHRLHYQKKVKTVVFYVDSECVIYRLRRVKALRKVKTITNLEVKRLNVALDEIDKLLADGVRVEIKHVNGDKNPADGPSRPQSSDQPDIPTKAFILKAARSATTTTLEMVLEPTEHLKENCDNIKADATCGINVIDVERFFEEDEIKRLQDGDPRVSTIKYTLRTVPQNERPNGMKMYYLGPNDILYYTGITSIVDKTRTMTPLPVVPRGRRVEECIRGLHREQGHAGASKLMAIYQTWYYTPKLRQVVRRLLQVCSVCQRARERSCTRRAGGVVRPVGLQFGVGSCYVLDLQGPFLDCGDESPTPQKKWGLTMMDPVSFHVLFDVLDNPSTQAVVDSVHKLVSMNGIPQAVVMDPGSCFTSSDFKVYLRSQAIAYVYLPREAGHLGGFHERIHGTILRQVRSRLAAAELEDQPIRFLTIYSEAIASINRLPLNDFGGLSPFEIYHGRRPRYLTGHCTGEDIRIGQEQLEEWLPGLRSEEQEVLDADLQALCEEIYERRCKSMTEYFDLWKERNDRVRQRMYLATLAAELLEV